MKHTVGNLITQNPNLEPEPKAQAQIPNIGTLRIRIGFWSRLYHNYNKGPPKQYWYLFKALCHNPAVKTEDVPGRRFKDCPVQSSSQLLCSKAYAASGNIGLGQASKKSLEGMSGVFQLLCVTAALVLLSDGLRHVEAIFKIITLPKPSVA